MIEKRDTPDVFEEFLTKFSLKELEAQAERYSATAEEYRKRASAVNSLIRLRRAMEVPESETARPPEPATPSEEETPTPRPSVPAAIRTVMGERPGHPWPVDELLSELEDRKWEPGGKT